MSLALKQMCENCFNSELPSNFGVKKHKKFLIRDNFRWFWHSWQFSVNSIAIESHKTYNYIKIGKYFVFKSWNSLMCHTWCVSTWLSCNIICIRVYHSNKDNNNAKYPFIKTVENELNPATNDREREKKTWKNAHVYKQHMKHIFFLFVIDNCYRPCVFNVYSK